MTETTPAPAPDKAAADKAAADKKAADAKKADASTPSADRGTVSDEKRDVETDDNGDTIAPDPVEADTTDPDASESWVVTHPVMHDGIRHEPGAIITLAHRFGAALHRAGHVVPEGKGAEEALKAADEARHASTSGTGPAPLSELHPGETPPSDTPAKK